MPPRPDPAVIDLDGIAIAVVRRRMRRLRLVVQPPHGRVVLSAPKWVPRRELVAFATAKADWIRSQQARIRALPAPPPVEYVDGEVHPVWGRDYALAVVGPGVLGSETTGSGTTGRRRVGVALDGDRLVLTVPTTADRATRARAFAAWYRAEATRAIGPLVAAWEEPLGVSVAAWTVRRMTTRWGSCTPRTRRLRFNAELAKRRPELLEYVVVHEMAHLVEPSHNARFKALLTAHMPDWYARHAELAARPITRHPSLADGNDQE